MVNNFAATIDVTDSQVVLQYGAAAQNKISSFSENALNSVRTKDMGEIGEMLTGLVTELRGFDAQESKGFFGLFKKSATKLKAQYDDLHGAGKPSGAVDEGYRAARRNV